MAAILTGSQERLCHFEPLVNSEVDSAAAQTESRFYVEVRMPRRA